MLAYDLGSLASGYASGKRLASFELKTRKVQSRLGTRREN